MFWRGPKLQIHSVNILIHTYIHTYICIRSYNTGRSFEPISMKFTRLVRIHSWVNLIVFGNNRPNETTDMYENEPQNWLKGASSPPTLTSTFQNISLPTHFLRQRFLKRCPENFFELAQMCMRISMEYFTQSLRRTFNQRKWEVDTAYGRMDPLGPQMQERQTPYQMAGRTSQRVWTAVKKNI